MPSRFASSVAFILVLFCPKHLHAADDAAPTAFLVGGESMPATLRAIEPDGSFRFQTPSGERAIQSQALVRWGNPSEPADGRVVLLADGSQVMAVDWAVGPLDQPLVLQGESLTFTASHFGSQTLPRHTVRGIILKVPVDLRERDRLLGQVHTFSEGEDAVLLVGGDRLTGRLAEINGQDVALETSLGRVQVPLANAVAVLFDTPAVKLADAPGEHVLVGLADGSRLSVREFVREGGDLHLHLTSGPTFRGAAASDIVSLQPFPGGVAYLSDLTPHRFVHVPYLSLEWPLAEDRNILGGRLRVGGRLFSKGLGVHSAARIVYRLDGTHQRFAALAAVDDSAGLGGSVVFRVLLALDKGWNEVFTSQTLRGGDEPVPISVPLADAKGLALVVDFADRGDELDYADWLDARLEKSAERQQSR
jgi:hypothetical protein